MQIPFLFKISLTARDVLVLNTILKIAKTRFGAEVAIIMDISSDLV
jgi:hypothetical protein